MSGKIPLLLADFIQAREPQTNLRISLDITRLLGGDRAGQGIKIGKSLTIIKNGGNLTKPWDSRHLFQLLFGKVPQTLGF
jgi:hypothetical protein